MAGWRLRMDWPLLVLLLLLSGLGFAVLYSAVDGRGPLLQAQGQRLALGYVVLLVAAQFPPQLLQRLAPAAYAITVLMLLAVSLGGDVGKGAQRWLDLGFMRFQPSELAKLAVPMMVAWYLAQRPLPVERRGLAVAAAIILLPVAMIVRQPDLGTALLVGGAGGAVLFLAGMSLRLMGGLLVVATAATPLFWHFLHNYQRQRILTLLDPQRDPLGAGYHVIQSTIAVGSGGLLGKGWMQGTQSHLDFIPESSTDFIFAVLAEEAGLLGALLLLTLYAFLLGRAGWLAARGQDDFSRLFAGALTATFFLYLFVNIGMVCGLLPVVGVPLPLVSYGGTSMVTLMAGFGLIMALGSQHRLWQR